MPYMKYDDVSIYYEESGSGYPILLYAPGSLSAKVEDWHGLAAFDPTVDFAHDFRLIAMDLRNAARSRAPIRATDGWPSYIQDSVALLDHLGIDRCHVMGQCIGGPLTMGLIKAVGDRVSAAVLLQPSGRVEPEFSGRSGGFDRWRETLQDHPEATPAVLDQVRLNLYTTDFVYTVPRDFVRTCQVPLLVCPGNDEVHPYRIGEEIAELAPHAELIPEWKKGAALEQAKARIREFFLAHVPSGAAAR